MADPKDAEIARLNREIELLRVHRDIVWETPVGYWQDRAEKAEAERDAALAQVAGDGYRLQKQHWFVETGWVDSGGQGYWTQTKESIEVATEDDARALTDQWLAEGKLEYMSWGEIRPTFSYGLFRIRSEWRDVSTADAIAARDRRDAQMRAEGRKEAAEAFHAEIRKGSLALEAEGYAVFADRFIQASALVRASILAAAEKEAGNG